LKWFRLPDRIEPQLDRSLGDWARDAIGSDACRCLKVCDSPTGRWTKPAIDDEFWVCTKIVERLLNRLQVTVLFRRIDGIGRVAM